MKIIIRSMRITDWNCVRSIYAEGIATGKATFEQEPPEWEVWDREHLENCRIVAQTKDVIAGWAALSPVSGRCVYSGVAELSVNSITSELLQFCAKYKS